MYELITPPTEEPVSLLDVKAALRVTHDQDDALIGAMLVTARTYLERRLDMVFLPQTWCASFEASSETYELRPGRVTSILKAELHSSDSVTTLTSDDWRLRASSPDRFDLVRAVTMADTDIRIDFISGYSSATLIPADLTRAITLLTAHYYEEREMFRAQRYVEVPLGVETLIAPYREARL